MDATEIRDVVLALREAGPEGSQMLSCDQQTATEVRRLCYRSGMEVSVLKVAPGTYRVTRTGGARERA